MNDEYEYLVRYTATGSDGAEMESQWVVTIETDSVEAARERFEEIISHVSWWSFDIEAIELKKD